MTSKLSLFFLTLYLISIVVKTTHSWKYQTKCTRTSKNSHNTNSEFQTDASGDSYSIVDDFEHVNQASDDSLSNKQMQLKCPNSNDFLFIGLTQYGVSSSKSSRKNDSCLINVNDCLVAVDYLANECNGLNSCDIQLEAQFLHTCKNLSDYLSIAYECIPGSKRIDVCSNDETFIVDNFNNLNSRFSNFFLTSPNYPNEYASNLNNCSCKLEYVKIDDNTQKKEDGSEKQNKMNLVFKSFEFDLEEGESSHSDMTNTVYSEKCNKDSFTLNSFESSVNTNPTETINLCGQHKEFKEFHMNGGLIKMNLTSDDAITRRGFLIEIQPTPETICPYGTERFNSKKCIKYFNEENGSSWSEAVESCKLKSGRLLTVNDFVDNLKLNNILRSKSIDLNAIWSTYRSIKSSNDEINFLNLKRSTNGKCISKSLNYWQDESCDSKLNYICEFDPIKLNSNMQTNENTNRLIRVSCGSLSSVYSSSSTTIETTTKKFPKRKQAPINKPVISWSSLIDKNLNPTKLNIVKKQKLSNVVVDLFTTRSVIRNIELLEENYQIDPVLKQEKLINNKSDNQLKSFNSTASPSKTSGVISQELALIIAVVCGVSIVLIIVNIFCIWNYYNRKLRAYIEKSETNTESNYRTSTLISRNAKLSTSSSNNRSMSTVDSYVKMLPTYETCISVPNYLQMTANSSPNSTACLLNNTNEQKIELLKSYLQKQSLDQQHYYETLSMNKNQNDYIIEAENKKICLNQNCMCSLKHFFNNQFDSMVVLPVNSMTSAPSSATSNSTVVLLNNNSYKQLQHNSMLNEIMASSMASPASNSQSKPLISFLSNIDNSSSNSSSTSASPAHAEL